MLEVNQVSVAVNSQVGKSEELSDLNSERVKSYCSMHENLHVCKLILYPVRFSILYAEHLSRLHSS
jgi:hypothetical protein